MSEKELNIFIIVLVFFALTVGFFIGHDVAKGWLF
jgi:preprotein translocase subunit SecE